MSHCSTKFVGIDLGDRKHQVCVLDSDGNVVAQESVVNDRAAVEELLHKFGRPEETTVAMETGTHSPWLSGFLEEQGFRVLVGNARRLRAIWTSDRKTDVHDAEMIARIARFDVKLLHPVKHRGGAAQRDLMQVKARDALVETRTQLINFVRGTLKSVGIRLPKCSTAAFVKTVSTADIDSTIRKTLEPVLQSVDTLTRRIRDYDCRIEALCAKYRETERLRQVAGVGPVTSLAFVLTLEDAARFAKSRDVGAYLGLVPKRDQSGLCDKPLPVTKAGNTYLRRLLVGAANYILGPFGPDCNLRRYGMRIAARGGKVAKRKAVVAVARKLAVLLHRLWVSGEQYEPLHSRNRSAETQVA